MLNLSHGDLGLHSLHCHAPAAYISSLTMSVTSDVCYATSKGHLLAAVNAYNAISPGPQSIKAWSAVHKPWSSLV